VTNPLFAARCDRDVVRLVLSQPLAWVVSGAGADFRATLLPLRPEVDESGALVRLVGHFARSNDHARLLQRAPHARILTLGAHGYISPSWIHDKTWGPTWNYASAQFTADLDFFEAPAQIEAHLRDLVGAMEAGRPGAWNIDQMGPRYHSLSRGVIGFRAHVREVRAKFKLGQDERDAVYSDIAAGLEGADQGELLQWMNAFNPARTNDGEKE
jgi:transcriptional regulator